MSIFCRALPEKKKTRQLIHEFERKGIHVLKKEMRDKRMRKKAYCDFSQA